MEPKKIILTGDRPTGPLHLGHYVGSLQNRVKLQRDYNQYILVADVQALTDNFENPDKVRKNLLELAYDYLAVGIDPNISTIAIQSMIPEISDLTVFYLNLVTVARLERNPTVKDEIRQKGYGSNVAAGFLCYPVSQAADITIFNANLVPVGADQIPMVEQTVEIVRKFNNIYEPIFVEPQALVPETCGRLPGIDGQTKMSKSFGNAIYLSDSADELKKKIMSMFTDPGHLRIGDPGKIEGNTVFTYLDIFDTDKKRVTELKEHYQRGGLGDVSVKKHLNEILQAHLAPIRELRQTFADDPAQIIKILQEGTKKARQSAAQTMSKIRKAMKINYF